jgi:tRNA 5-methylaminomethyl-2-thiouridine biosynthesis bifunctional protein
LNASSHTAGLAPAQLSFDASGLPRSRTFDDIYHSQAGATGQACHVFLAGNGLPQRWRGQHSFTIIETGFGLGINFLTTWQTLRADSSAPARLHYLSAEQNPPHRDDLLLVQSGRA